MNKQRINRDSKTIDRPSRVILFAPLFVPRPVFCMHTHTHEHHTQKCVPFLGCVVIVALNNSYTCLFLLLSAHKHLRMTDGRKECLPLFLLLPPRQDEFVFSTVHTRLFHESLTHLSLTDALDEARKKPL